MDKEKFTKIHFVLGLYAIVFISFIAIFPIRFNNEFLANMFTVISLISFLFIPFTVVLFGIAFLLDPLNNIDITHQNEIIIITMSTLNYFFPVGYFIYVFSQF